MTSFTAYDPVAGSVRLLRLHSGWIQQENGVAAERPVWLCGEGFCDLQVNGAFGIDVNAAGLTTARLRELNARLLAEGVTAWLPTLVSAPPNHIIGQLRALAQACRQDELLSACIPGFHLEGPWISPLEGWRGAHDAASIHPPSWEEFEAYQNAAGGKIRLVTLAPEQPGALDMIARLAGQGVTVALGHSAAHGECLREAAAAGARLSTHLGNGMPAMMPRHANPFLEQLVMDELRASVIFDGHHLPPETRMLLRRAKGIERLIMISDATRLAGMSPGVYDEAIGGRVELSATGRLALLGTPYLAGSARTLKQCVESTLADPSMPLSDVLRMAVINPRQLLALPRNSLIVFSASAQSNTVEIHLSSVNQQVHYHSPQFQPGGTHDTPPIPPV